MRWLTKSLDQMRGFERSLSAASKLIDHRPPPPTSLVLCYERVLVRGVPQTRWVMLREVVREMLDEALGRSHGGGTGGSTVHPAGRRRLLSATVGRLRGGGR